MRLITPALAIVLLSGLAARAAEPPPAITVYDSDPAHLWNRLHGTLRVRETAHDGWVGADSVDLILWSNSKHLLDGPSHRRAIEVLDEFVAQHAERLIEDPLKRAVLQRDLWAIFDWTCGRDGDGGES